MVVSCLRPLAFAFVLLAIPSRAVAAQAPPPPPPRAVAAQAPPPPPPQWTIQIDPLTLALGFAHVQVERALGDHASLYVGPSVRLFDPLSKEKDAYIGVGGEAGVRVFPWGAAPRGAWGEVRGVLAWLHTDARGGATAVGGYASVLGGYTWILADRWVLAAGLGVQYIHYRVAGLGSVGILPAAHTAFGVAF
jgi:hypothetical protein